MVCTKWVAVVAIGLPGAAAEGTAPPVRLWSWPREEWTGLVSADQVGNVYRTGVCADGVDLDPTEGVDAPIPCGVFVSKLYSDGSYAWSRTLQGLSGVGSLLIEPGDIAAGPGGQVFVVGSFRGTVDFDPTAAVDTRTAGGQRSAFILALGPDGEYLGTRVLQSTLSSGYTLAGEALVDTAGNLFVGGNFGKTDFDPGPGTDIRAGISDAFVSKFAPDGAYLWTRTFGSTAFDAVSQLELDPEGNVLASGEFRGTVDFDWGQEQDLHTAVIPGATFIMKMTNDGEYLWTRSLQILPTGGPPIAVCPGGSIWLAGAYSNTYSNFFIDFDPTEGENWHEATGIGQVFLSKLTGEGGYVGTWFIPGTESAWVDGIECDEAGGVLLLGSLGYTETGGTIDLDPGPGEELYTGTWINFLVRLNADASFDWARIFTLDDNRYEGQSWMEPFDFSAGAGGIMTLYGRFGLSYDFDPGCAEAIHESQNEIQSYFMLRLASPAASADADENGVVDLFDFGNLHECVGDPCGEGQPAVCPSGCYNFDFAAFQRAFAP